MRRQILFALAWVSILLFDRLPASCAQVGDGDNAAHSAENRSIGDLLNEIYAGRISPASDKETTRALALHSRVRGSTAVVASYIDTHGESLILDCLDKQCAELIPHLLALLDDTDALVRIRVAEAFYAMGLQRYNDQEPLIKQLGDKAKPIGPALLQRLDDSDQRVAMSMAIALIYVDPELGKQAVPRVVEWLKNGVEIRPFSSNSMVQSAYNLRPVAEAAIPALIEALDEEDKRTRSQIVQMVYFLPGALEPLCAALKHEKVFIRIGAATALGLLGNANAVPALVEALQDDQRLVRFAAATALVRTRSNDETAVVPIRAAVPVLIEVSRDRHDQDQLRAVHLFAKIGPSAEAALPDLIALLKDDRFEFRFQAALAIVAIDQASGTKAVDVLIEGTESPDHHNQAVESLVAIGPPAKKAASALEKFYNVADIHRRFRAAAAVALIDPEKAETAVNLICEFLKEKKNRDSSGHYSALTSLAKIGPAAKSAVPTLGDLLSDRDRFPNLVCEAIAVIGPDAKALEPKIRTLLATSKHEPTIKAAQKALDAIGAEN